VTTLVNNLGILVIAAGSSTRLGQAKQFIMIDGQPLITRIARLAGEFSKNVYCILGCEAEKILPRLEPLPVVCLINEHWQQGMGASIACGVAQLGDDIDAALILLCDQWALTHADIDQLVDQWQTNPKKIIASQYFDKKQAEPVCGVPVIFPRKYFAELTELKKIGGRKLLEYYRSEVIHVGIANAAFDLDTPDDLRILRDCYPGGSSVD